MTLQPYTNPGGTVAVSPDPMGAISDIVRWAQDLATAGGAIAHIVDTAFVPDSFWPMPPGVSLKEWKTPKLKYPRETDEEYHARRRIAIASASSAVVYGHAIGYAPPAALQSIYVVRGKPGMYAEAMAALVKSHGHEIEIEELTDSRCVVRGRRKGATDWQRFTFTMDRARRAGYTKQNEKYDADPQAMLLPRCLSIACRAIAPDALKGIAAVEDLTDEPDGEQRQDAARTRTVRRATPPPALAAPAPAGHPLATPQPRQDAPAGPPLPGEDEPPTPPVPASVSRSIDPATWRRINARFVELDVTGPGQTADRLAVISEITGRLITRGGELTTDEGQLVLDNLAGDAGRTVVDVALDRGPAQTAPEQSAEPAQDAIVGDADPDNDADVDPTTEPGWGTEGDTPPLPGDQTW